MRSLAPRLVACALLGAGAAQAQPFSLDHLLAQQRLGPVSIDPSQRWLVAPVTAPYRAAPRWDLEDQTPMTITQLRVFDLRHGGPPKVYPAQVGAIEAWGYSPGPYAPSGERMAIVRARGRHLEVGILTLASGAVVWTGLYPVSDETGRALQWRGETTLLVLAKAPEAPALSGVIGWPVQERLVEKWAATHANRPSVTVMGSGRFLDRNPPPLPARLVAVEAATGRGTTLANDAFVDLEIAPDGRHAALLAQGETLRPDPGRPALTTDPRLSFRLSVIDLSTGAAWTPCPDCDVAPDLLAWSPSGAALLVYARKDAEAWSAGRYWRIDPGERRIAPLAHPAYRPALEATAYGRRLPRADWMGETPLVLARPAATPASEPDWLAWRGAAPVNLTAALPPGRRSLEAASATALVAGQGGRLWRIDATGRATALGAAASVQGPGLPGGARLAVNQRPRVEDLMLAVTVDAETRAAAVSDRGLRALGVAAPAEETLLAAAGQVRAVASLQRDAHGVETLVLRRAGRPPRALATLNAHLAGVEFSTPTAVTHVGPQGQTLTSWLYRPPGHKAGTKLPLIVIPYPGRVYGAAPSRQAPPASQLFLNAQLMAAAGYAVLLPSLPIDPGREPADGLATDILAVADAAAGGEPDLDLSRLALWGHSYGGYAVLVAAAQSPRFKAVIAGAFAADLTSHYSRGNLYAALAPDRGLAVMESAGWAELGQGRMGAPPWKDPDRYVRNSPLFLAGKITAPLLLVMGDLDSDPGQAMTMFGAAFRQDKDAICLTYHGEGHVYLTPANVADLHHRILAFLGDTLGPAPDR